MSRTLASAMIGLAISVSPVTAQSITDVSPSVQTLSGRLILTGSGFGATPGAVEIGGVDAPVSFWSDTKVRVYVPETAPLGGQDVVVTTPGPSNVATVNVTSRPAPTDRLLWRFVADDPYMLAQPAVALDGTVYATGIYGHLYALAPDGGLKWIRNVNAVRGPAVAADGTIYVGAGGGIRALDPDGNTLWTTPLQGSVMMGPNVGPDGKIYGACDLVSGPGTGTGAFILSPSGELLSSFPGPSIRGMVMPWEVSFTDEHWYVTSGMGGPVHGLYGIFAFNYDGTLDWEAGGLGQSRTTAAGLVGVNDPNGNSCVVYSDTGTEVWRRSLTDLGGVPDHPTIGPDGTFYVLIQSSRLHAIDTTGAVRWMVQPDATPIFPVVRPDNAMVITGGWTGFGIPHTLQAMDPATGELLWSQDLDDVDGLRPLVWWYPEFSPDGNTVYAPTTGQTAGPDPWTHLYAVDTRLDPTSHPADLDGDGVVGFTDLLTLLASWGDCPPPCPADLDGDGAVGFADLLTMLAAWGAG